MKPIEAQPDKKHCEMCGALICGNNVDPLPDYDAAELMRRLAFVADESPAVALLLVHHLAGRSQSEIARKLKLNRSTVCRRLQQSQATIRKLNTP